jgi:lysozyme family protein
VTSKELLNALTDYPKRFAEFMPFIFRWENVVSKKGNILIENDPDDPGGETFAGLDRRSHRFLNFKTITPKQVCDVYLKEWQDGAAEEYPYPLGEALFDAEVNCGSGRAAKLLNLAKGSAAKFCDEREAFYYRLAAQKPTLKKFLKGWIARVRDLREYLNIK